ncbi:type I-E CRISPR-associated protein Cse2/CasB [Streptomyces sp. NPDC051976]|uniref:type I-E CRISPR-associated protein Cse2/CasB n=1 Tax=Streptomyces sp. NPDC051976 TaxID=3154947 RepID=UPI003449DDFC
MRRDLRDGRGRPVDECKRMHRYLSVRTAGHGHRRVHYTVACLIAFADPLEAERDRPTPLPPPRDPQPPAAGPAVPMPVPGLPAAPADTDRPYTTLVWRSRPNLGATLARAVREAGFHDSSTDDLLHTIVSVDDDHLHPHILPSLTSRLLRAQITPDWPVLLEDLSLRAFDADQVATRWLDGFYRALINPTGKD